MIAALSNVSFGTIAKNVSDAILISNEPELISHYDIRFINPLDTDLLDAIFLNYNKIITVEDGVVNGGFGSAIIEYATKKSYKGNIEVHGIPDRFIEQGTNEELHKECGIDEEGIYQAVKSII